MSKSKVIYVWTEKAQKVTKGKAVAGQPATFHGHKITPKRNSLPVKVWLATGYIVEAPSV